MRLRGILLGCSLLTLFSGCVQYHRMKEIKFIGFDEDTTKGKSVGQFTSDDCNFMVFGYWIGGQPDFSKAMANARTGKMTGIADSVTGGKHDSSGGIRYANNVTYANTGFNAVIVGKQCIEIRGVGYR